MKPNHPKTSRGLGSVGRHFRYQERMRTDAEFREKRKIAQEKWKLKRRELKRKEKEGEK